jgi:hypothetical protein
MREGVKIDGKLGNLSAGIQNDRLDCPLQTAIKPRHLRRRLSRNNHTACALRARTRRLVQTKERELRVTTYEMVDNRHELLRDSIESAVRSAIREQDIHMRSTNAMSGTRTLK